MSMLKTAHSKSFLLDGDDAVLGYVLGRYLSEDVTARPRGSDVVELVSVPAMLLEMYGRLPQDAYSPRLPRD